MTTQLNNLLSLLGNFDHALQANEVALNSAGSAARENSKFLGGLEAKTNQLKATFEKLSNTVIDSGLVAGVLDLANAFLKLFDSPIGPFVIQMTALTGLLWGGNGVINAGRYLVSFFRKMKIGSEALGASLALTGPQFMLIAAGMTALVAIMPKAVDLYKKLTDEGYKAEESLRESKEQLQLNKEKLEELNKIAPVNRTDAINDEIEALKKQNEELERNIELQNQKIAVGGFKEKTREFHEAEGYYLTTSDYGQLEGGFPTYLQDSENSLLFVSTAEEALRKLEQLGYDTKQALQEAGNDAEKALNILNVKMQEGVKTIAGEEYYDFALAKFKDFKDKLEAGVTDTDIVTGYSEAKSAMDELIQSIEDFSDSNLQDANLEWVIKLRAEYLNLVGVSDEVVDKFYSVGESLGILTEGYAINATQLQQLEDAFPGIAEALEKTNQGWISNTNSLTEMLAKMGEANVDARNLSEAYSSLTGQAGATQSQIDKLAAVFPGLTNVVKKNTSATYGVKDAYYIEAQALVDLAETGNAWAIAMMKNQDAATTKQLMETKTRVKAMSHELSALVQTTSQAEEIRDLMLRLDKLHAKEKELEELFVGGYAETGGLIVAPSPPGVGGGGSGSGSKRDPIAEQSRQFKEQIAIMEHKLFLMEKEGATEEERIEQMRKIQDEIERQKQWYYDQGLDENSEYIRDLEKQWWEYEDNIKSVLQDQADIYELLFSTVAQKAQDEIDILEKKKQEIRDQNDELERQMRLEQALDNLAKAKQKKVLVYRNGQMEYAQDVDAISRTQSEVDKIKQEETLNDKLEAIDKEIEKWEDYRDAWGSVVDDYKQEQDLLLLEQKLGIKLEGDNWKQRLNNLQDYVNEYNKILSQIGVAGATSYSINPASTNTFSSARSVSTASVNTFSLGEPAPGNMISNLVGKAQNAGKTISIAIQNFNPNLPNVTDGADFANYLAEHFWLDTMQFVKT